MVEIQARQHPRYGWVIVTVRVAGKLNIDMMVNFGVPRSRISAAVRDRLIMEELVLPRRERNYVLPDVAAGGPALPPLAVRVSGALALIGAGGILGLDFFAQFEDTHFHVPSFRLTLSGS